MGVPWKTWEAQLQLFSQSFRDHYSIVPKTGERSRGTAELNDEHTIAKLMQASPVPKQGIKPAGGLEPEDRWHGLLKPSPRGHRSRTMLAGEIRSRFAKAVKLHFDRIESVAQLQNQPRIDYVLAGGTPMDVSRRIAVGCLHETGQLLDQRDGEVAGIYRIVG
jgi:hypothetical protein